MKSNKKINKNKEIKNEHENGIEDTTKYGEFVSSFFEWMTPEEQKRRAKHLENLENEGK